MKKIIALAVASAFVAPVVMAEVTVYGSLRPHVEYSKITDNGSNDLTRVRLVDGYSRLGFKGTDKLDNGMQLFWQVENRIRIGENNATAGFNSRDTFVGVRGNFGELKAGKISDLTDQFSDDVVTALDYWNGSSASAYLFAIRDDSRLNNSAQYTSPIFLGGLQAKAMYDFGAKTTAANYQGYQASLAYTHKLFKVGGIYKQNNDTSSTGNSIGAAEDFYKNYTLGASLTPIDGLDFSAMWTRIKTRAGATETKQDSWALGAMYATGKHGFGVQYGKINDAKVNGVTSTDSGAYAMVGQYKYALSKQTRFIAAIGHTRNDKNATFNQQDPASGTIIGGAKVTTISAGLRTDF